MSTEIFQSQKDCDCVFRLRGYLSCNSIHGWNFILFSQIHIKRGVVMVLRIFVGPHEIKVSSSFLNDQAWSRKLDTRKLAQDGISSHVSSPMLLEGTNLTFAPNNNIPTLFQGESSNYLTLQTQLKIVEEFKMLQMQLKIVEEFIFTISQFAKSQITTSCNKCNRKKR